MKLCEIKKTPEDLAKAYLHHYRDERKAHKEFGADMETVCTEPGNCSMVSIDFEMWADREAKVKAKSLTGIGCKNSAWLKRANVRAGSEDDAHTVAVIGDKIIDFTARQFDKSMPFPRIVSVAQFKSEWEKVE